MENNIISTDMSSTIYTIRLLCSLFATKFKHRFLFKGLSKKPKVINFNATEVCNSSCTMCNIWKNEKGKELSPQEIEVALSDKLFSEVAHVGVTGGEPTLRTDLPQIFEAIISALPSLKGLSLITNCIEADAVISQIALVRNICINAGKDFSMMVSLDGIGKEHDRVRGVKGNFESTMKVVEWVRSQGISFAFGATISKANVWDADDLLFFAKTNNLYGRFRVAEFINRLNNSDRSNVIRNFSDNERYNLWLLFFKLQFEFEKSKLFKRTYRSIGNVLYGGSRLIGCPYQADGIVFNAKGEIAYCAPKSTIIGNASNNSALIIYQKNIKERRRILKEDCGSCIHDYHAPLSYDEHVAEIKQIYSKRFAKDTRWRYLSFILPFIKKPKHTGKHTVFIVGWYGTETVGDKAILGSIVDYYQAQYSDCQIVIGSLYPTVSRRTCIELALKAEVVDTQSIDLLTYAAMADVTVMGGGPLMDLDELYVPLRAFEAARKNKKKTVVYGCGLGPLNRKSHIAKQILSLADEIALRDEASVRLAREWFPLKEIICTGDPAQTYVRKLATQITPTSKNELACYLREWTTEYKTSDETSAQFLEKRNRFEAGIAKYVIKLADELKVESIRFYHMHNFVLGGDDRDFSRRFIAQYFPNDSRVSFDKGLSSVHSTIESMKASRFNLCMRFHSVVFADVLGTEYAAIDYTRGGKIFNFLKDREKLSFLTDCDTLMKLADKD